MIGEKIALTLKCKSTWFFLAQTDQLFFNHSYLKPFLISPHAMEPTTVMPDTVDDVPPLVDEATPVEAAEPEAAAAEAPPEAAAAVEEAEAEEAGLMGLSAEVRHSDIRLL